MTLSIKVPTLGQQQKDVVPSELAGTQGKEISYEGQLGNGDQRVLRKKPSTREELILASWYRAGRLRLQEELCPAAPPVGAVPLPSTDRCSGRQSLRQCV